MVLWVIIVNFQCVSGFRDGVEITSQAALWNSHLFQIKSFLESVDDCHAISGEDHDVIHTGCHMFTMVTFGLHPQIKICLAGLEAQKWCIHGIVLHWFSNCRNRLQQCGFFLHLHLILDQQ